MWRWTISLLPKNDDVVLDWGRLREIIRKKLLTLVGEAEFADAEGSGQSDNAIRRIGLGAGKIPTVSGVSIEDQLFAARYNDVGRVADGSGQILIVESIRVDTDLYKLVSFDGGEMIVVPDYIEKGLWKKN